MRLPLLAVVALAFLRIVCGLHFFLEGTAHLRDPEWSSAGFRKAAVGPLAEAYRATLPQTGNWSGTLGTPDDRSAAEASTAWQASVVSSWNTLLKSRAKAVPLTGDARAAADESLAVAGKELAAFCDGIAPDLAEYREQLVRLASTTRRPESREIPFERERVAKKRRELATQASGWMASADAIGHKLVAAWDAQLPDDKARRTVAAAAEPTPLWKADRFVSWSLVTIGGCLVIGLFTKFNAMGAACFLVSVIATQPFWVPGAQPTYNQWVELAALLVIAALPTGGWSGLDFFLRRWCPLARCCGGCGTSPA